MSDHALEVSNLSKSFDRPAVNKLSFTVYGGEFYSLLGPNGAGKTTSLRMVAGLLQADSGAISVFGENALTNPIGVKKMMAWVPDEPMIYDRLTPLEYLEFVAGLWEIESDDARKNANELLDWLALAPHARLDAGSARLVKDVLLARVEKGCSVIMTTHILEVAERMAERIGVISKGRLIAEGTLEGLRNQTGEQANSLEEIFLELVEDDKETDINEQAA